MFDKPPKVSNIRIEEPLEVDDAVLKMLTSVGCGKLIEDKHVTKRSKNIFKQE